MKMSYLYVFEVVMHYFTNAYIHESVFGIVFGKLQLDWSIVGYRKVITLVDIVAVYVIYKRELCIVFLLRS